MTASGIKRTRTQKPTLPAKSQEKRVLRFPVPSTQATCPPVTDEEFNAVIQQVFEEGANYFLPEDAPSLRGNKRGNE